MNGFGNELSRLMARRLLIALVAAGPAGMAVGLAVGALFS